MDRRSIRIAAAFSSMLAGVVDVAAAQGTTLVSVDSTGVQGNRDSGTPALSADGRFVAFLSDASNLVTSDTNSVADVFVHDRKTGTTERVSVDSSGAQANGPSEGVAISADGRFVAFMSGANNLIANDTNGSVNDVFVHDRTTGVTEVVSVDSSGNQGDNPSFAPTLSADGRFVAFLSEATNLIAGGTNSSRKVYVHDRSSGTTQLVSVDSSGKVGNGWCYLVSISADGRFVAFVSDGDNLVAGDTNGQQDVFVHDLVAGTTVCASVDSSGVIGDELSEWASISGDGRFVAFSSWSTNLVPNDANGSNNIYVHDVQTGVTELDSVTSSGVQADNESDVPAISADGRFVVFSSWASNLTGVSVIGTNVFVHDRKTGATNWVSAKANGQDGNGDSGDPDNRQFPAISGNGQFFAFWSDSNDLVANDTNLAGDIFVHGPNLTLDASPDSVPAGATLTFDSWTGKANDINMLVAVDIDGTACFIPVLFGGFDASGSWTLSAVVPSGLAGHVISFQIYGHLPTGRIATSNTAAVTFQ